MTEGIPDISLETWRQPAIIAGIMSRTYRFDRLEFAGSLGDLGTLLPLALGMILINGLSPAGVLWSIGIFYILSGVYFKTTVPVQPMKVVAAYAIASGMAANQILAAGLMIGVLMLVLGGVGAVTWLGRHTPKPVVRGVQLSTGVLLMTQGIRFMIGTSRLQQIKTAAEPYLAVQTLGPIPIGLILGIFGALITLLFIENRRFPGGILAIGFGLAAGLVLGTRDGMDALRIGFYFPDILPTGFPVLNDFIAAFFLLVLPQIPMTLGNAVIAYVDLSRDYFGQDARRTTYRSAAISMALANLMCFLVGGIPLCHGSGGLAAHYRFGARTAGSNIMIGGIFLVLAILLGAHALSVLNLLPLAVLGVLLVFAGAQLGLSILDLTDRNDLFIALLILAITLAVNLAAGFIAGFTIGYIFRWWRLRV